MANEFGDGDFKDYMDREYNKQDPLMIIIKAIRYKMLAISDIYSKTLDAYMTLKDDDPLKPELKAHILRMMEHTKQTMNQYNYALISDDDIVDTEEEGLNGI